MERIKRMLRLGLAAGSLLLLACQGVMAVPRLDLSGYPQPAAGDRRWVIQLPGVLPPSTHPEISSNPRDWRVQLVVGQMALVDCNQHSFSARIRPRKLPDGRGVLLRVRDVGPLASTRMACPGRPPESRFVVMAGKPFVMPYSPSRPIVVDAPAPLEVRWRLWKAETTITPAQRVP